MSQKLVALVLLLVIVSPGCMMWCTHKECGCRKLWGIDVESAPVPTNGQTTPLVPHHHQQKQMKQLPAPPAPMPPAPASEIYFLPTPEAKKVQVETVAPPAPAVKTETIPAPGLPRE